MKDENLFKKIFSHKQKRVDCPVERTVERKKVVQDENLVRKTLSSKLEQANCSESAAEKEKTAQEVSELIWKTLEQRAMEEEVTLFCNDLDKPCTNVSMRQLGTAEWFLGQIEKGDKKAAFHYLSEYVDNYQSGWHVECSEHELQIIWLMCQILQKFGQARSECGYESKVNYADLQNI